MKKNYEAPILETISFSIEAVLTVSGELILDPDGAGTEIGGPIDLFG